MYCVECGKKGKLYEHLCGDCFTQRSRFSMIPKVIKLILCSNCYSRKKGKHWEESGSDEESLENTIIENITSQRKLNNPKYNIESELIRTNILKVKINIESGFDDLVIKEKLETEVRIIYNLCNRCSRISGNYFEAIIQVRGTNRNLDDQELKRSEDIIRTGIKGFNQPEQNAFLAKIQYIHGGVDFYLGSSVVARQLTKRLSKEFVGKIKESKTLVGRKDGKELFRITFNVRILEYKVGEFVEMNDQVFQVLTIHRKNVNCLNLETGLKQRFNMEQIDNFRLLGGSEFIYDAILVVESELEVQVLDPESYRTIELVKPKNFILKGDSVKIFKNQDRYYLLPNLELI